MKKRDQVGQEREREKRSGSCLDKDNKEENVFFGAIFAIRASSRNNNSGNFFKLKSWEAGLQMSSLAWPLTGQNVSKHERPTKNVNKSI